MEIKNIQKRYNELSQALPLQQKQLSKPRSLFPFLPLPQFQYTLIQQQTISINDSTDEIFTLESNSLQQLFNKPIYLSTSIGINYSNLSYGCIKMNPSLSTQHHEIINPIHNTIINNNIKEQLLFQSRFESGNLAMANISRNNNKVYYLLLQKDINTTRCTQWFFFRIHNNKIHYNNRYTFHIINLLKTNSTFNQGMKICTCCQSQGYIWNRKGENIKYRKTNLQINNNSSQYYYSLSFEYIFNKQNDITYFSYTYPYTFSMMDKHLLSICHNNPQITKRKTLAITPGNNYVDMITITNKKNNENTKKNNNNNKKNIIITARVHPGQTPSSFVCQGLINQLISKNDQTNRLRDVFIFRIIPMLNPDGVIHGNYRCGLTGNDLNRVWLNVQKQKYPEIYYVKKMISQLKECFLFIDLHAHSRKKGVFMYGCQNKITPYLCRQIPFLFQKNINQFNYYQCKFNMVKNRQGTSRVAIWKMLNIPYCYTMQHSFCGPNRKKQHFTVQNYRVIGGKIATTLEIYYANKIYRKNNNDKIITTINNNKLQTVLSELYKNKQMLEIGSELDEVSSSDNDLQIDQVQVIESNKILRNSFRGLKKINENLNNTMIASSKLSFNKYCTPKKQQWKVDKNYIIKIGSMYKNQQFYQVKPLPIVGTSPYDDELKVRINSNNKSIYSSYNETVSNDKKQQKNNQQLNIPFRYNEDINKLTNLFLPSLTSASYQKYGKRLLNNNKNKTVGIIEQKNINDSNLFKNQIKKVQKKKKKNIINHMKIFLK